MRVRVEQVRLEDRSPFLTAAGYGKETQFDVTAGTSYDVYAIAVHKGVVFCQVRGESGYPFWVPLCLCTVVEGTVPNDWVCNSFDDSVQLVLGPDFVASSESAYRDMVELAAESVELFDNRVTGS